jgi:hypothetical protein
LLLSFAIAALLALSLIVWLDWKEMKNGRDQNRFDRRRRRRSQQKVVGEVVAFAGQDD